MKYKKLLEKINDIVETDWCFEMVDGKHNLRKGKDVYLPFTQKEAQEMSKALGEIYSLSHQTHCKACRK